jgi:hypothetical protein
MHKEDEKWASNSEPCNEGANTTTSSRRAIIMEKPPQQACRQRTKVESIPFAFSGDLTMGT